ncbi:MAG: hypothetical protein ACU0CO_11505 [Shimia sp.]
MTNRLATIFAALIVGLILLDLILAGGANMLFLLKRMMELIAWMAFWR